MNPAPSSVLEPPAQPVLLASAGDEQYSLGDPSHPSHSPILSAHPVATAAWHAFLWLAIGNAIGVMLAFLLLVPSLNTLLGE